MMTFGHAQACIRIRQQCTEPRHDVVAQAIARVIESGGGVRVQREVRRPPIDGARQHRLRPDLLVDESILADVVISTPTCKSYVDRGSDRKGMVSAMINEHAKRAKYAELAASERCKFFPLAFESYGGWGTHALAFFNEVALRHETRNTITTDSRTAGRYRPKRCANPYRCSE